jgi:hypothetical protein
MKKIYFNSLIGLLCLSACHVFAAERIVAPSGGDYTSIQAAVNASVAGDTVTVRSGTYAQGVTITSKNNITLRADAGATAVVDPNSDTNCVKITNSSNIRVIGFKLTNSNTALSDVSGVRVEGSGSGVEIRDNEIYNLRGADAMGITVYGTEATAISAIVINNNFIHNCEPAHSEALTLNGNITNFVVSSNTVQDVDNIGIDFIGGETDINPNSTLVARNGTCIDNHVTRARSSYGGGYAGGIYVDGGRDIVIERNVVTQSDMGLEIGAENAGLVTSGIIVRNNVFYNNDKAGIVFGGYDGSVGTVEDCQFVCNTLYRNTPVEDNGEIWVQYGSDNLIANNIIYAISGKLFIGCEPNVANTFNGNLWFGAAGAGSAKSVWRGTSYNSFAAFKAASSQEALGDYADPGLTDAAAGNFSLLSSSLAIDRLAALDIPGMEPGILDIGGDSRLHGAKYDAGADEYHSAAIITPSAPRGLRIH